MRKERIGFIGAGNMAEAIADAMLAAEIVAAEAVSACDISAERRNVFAAKGVRTTANPLDVAAQSDALIMAVKPQNLPDVFPVIGPALKESHLVISICAGIPTGRFEAAAQAPLRVVRVMPNTPLQVRLGATALCKGRHATDTDLDFAAEIFGAAGEVVCVEECLMNAVTALSGSGPAYFYALTEALIEAGVQQGLDRDIARRLAIQTARGAGEMMAIAGASPEELRRRVTSKGGTTEAALSRMAEGGFTETMIAAVAAAVDRAIELETGEVGR